MMVYAGKKNIEIQGSETAKVLGILRDMTQGTASVDDLLYAKEFYTHRVLVLKRLLPVEQYRVIDRAAASILNEIEQTLQRNSKGENVC